LNRVNLLDFDQPGLVAFFESIGEKPFRARRCCAGCISGADDFEQMTDLAKSLRAKLPRWPRSAAGAGHDSVPATARASGCWKSGPNNRVETVFIPEDDRGTLCVSSQVGCALDCASAPPASRASTATCPPPRSSASCGGPIAWGADPKGERIISNVVLMGMGEPLLNFDNTVAAVSLMLDDHAYGLSRRRVTISTSGIVPAMDRLRDGCPWPWPCPCTRPTTPCATNWCRSTASTPSRN
jgi:23S rRNA (adenine2503-C2)-methyltransferase